MSTQCKIERYSMRIPLNLIFRTILAALYKFTLQSCIRAVAAGQSTLLICPYQL